ncbi:uncharacterized protein A1O9_08817 [Exophiala aquamarina CBS 119918]|uniref:Uncharacterized protein n=1 Tax=Exophiala aquamarina CBS 119918 TaxID=1182545 RepID=A0A072P7B0_9EURO|nr:uncharacterized protein A1O9_08817 [Exophiala aquamarina CBS 119918]KEF55163.1 hypothetical protein A1O9_08817 [Exophiala aquamarina CBS 119918]
MVHPVGIIITVTVLVAASLAAYENPQVRAWIDRTRHKVAMGLHSLGDGVHPNPRPRPQRRSTDVSMHEEKGEMAEARRQRAVAEIMERGRLLEERRKRRRSASGDASPQSPSFDTLVDNDGRLREKPLQDSRGQAATSAIETMGHKTSMRSRYGAQTSRRQSEPGPTETQQPADASISVTPLITTGGCRHEPHEQHQPFESRYEQEMREAWNIPLSDRSIEIPSSHASESLIALTPTTDAPDPDFSVPSAEFLRQPVERSDYFSAAMANSTRTLSEGGSLFHESNHSLQDNHLSRPLQGLANESTPHTPSLSGSISDIHASDAGDTSDDMLSEDVDGIRTPGSVWTEVDSAISGDL